MTAVILDADGGIVAQVNGSAGIVAIGGEQVVLKPRDRKPPRNIFDEPFETTVKQIESWWPHRRRV